MINLQPTPGFLLIKPDDSQEKTSSGIYLPNKKDDMPQRGVILAMGKDIKFEVNLNDRIIFKRWGGNQIIIDNVEYMFIRYEDVLAIET